MRSQNEARVAEVGTDGKLDRGKEAEGWCNSLDRAEGGKGKKGCAALKGSGQKGMVESGWGDGMICGANRNRKRVASDRRRVSGLT